MICLIVFTGNVKKYEQMLVGLRSVAEDFIKETVLEFKKLPRNCDFI